MSTLDEPIKLIDPSSVSGRSAGIKWGIVGAGLQILIDLLGYLTGMMKPGDTSYSLLTFVIATVCIVIAIRQHKEELGGYIRGARCVNVGLWSGLAYGIVSGIWGLVFYNLLIPEFYDEMNANMILMYENMGYEDDQIESMMGVAKMTQTPIGGIIASIFGGLFTGGLFSAIAALFLKKKAPGTFS